MISHFQTFAAYNQWANRRVYDAVSQLSDDAYKRDRGMFFQSFEGTLNHLMITDMMWLHRLTGEGPYPQTLNAILYDDFQSLRDAREALDTRIIKFVDSVSENDFDTSYEFITVSYGPMSGVLRDILAHFFNHQTHHRGQIHNCLSQDGVAPPPLDLMLFTREQER